MARRKKNPNRLGMIGIVAVVMILCVVIAVKTQDLQETNRALIDRQQKLEQQLENEQQRSLDLEERRVYVQTKQYVEEVAKKLGLVYPDEIIFKAKE